MFFNFKLLYDVDSMKYLLIHIQAVLYSFLCFQTGSACKCDLRLNIKHKNIYFLILNIYY